jgi:sugar lactone lactonase YvrE
VVDRFLPDGIAIPNGMLVTPDDATLVIAESFAGRLTAFDIADDGGLSNRRVWADGLGPDSICLDADGAVWTHAADTRATRDATRIPRARVSASAKAARCCSGSSSTAAALPACSEDPTAGHCSC